MLTRRAFFAHTPALLYGFQAPLPHASQPKKVLVLGAGLAGLAAAYELRNAGHEITILEAQLRPGGRVQTFRSFSEDLYGEAGASQILANHNWTLQYAKLFDLHLESRSPGNLQRLTYVNRKRIRMTPDTNLLDYFQVTDEEKKAGINALYQRYMFNTVREVAAAGDPKSDEWPPASVAKYDQYTWREFLQRNGASEGAVDLMMFGSFPEQTSALYVLRLFAQRAAAEGSHIAGGNDLLPRAFAAKLSDRIRYGSPVVAIQQNQQGVRAVTERFGVRETFDADHLICALPFTTLRRITVTPAFSESKQRTIMQLPYSAAMKVFLQTRSRFWEKDGLSGYARTYDPLPLEIVNDSAGHREQRGLLHTYFSGDLAVRLAAKPEPERIASEARRLDAIFPGMLSHLEGGLSKVWDHDEWAAGGFSVVAPGQYESLVPHIARVEGRIHFAGEHASPWPGWMQGAIASGLRAAAEVNSLP